METIEFKPSAIINKGWINTEFQNAEKELVAAVLLTIIQNKSDDWNTPITLEEFVESLPKINIGPMSGMLHTLFMMSGKSLVYSLLRFEDDGFVKFSDDRKEIWVTEKMIEFYSKYLG